MYKLKTHKGLAKRVRITGTGKVKFKKGGMGHLTGHMSGSTRRRLNESSYVKGKMASKIKVLIGAN